MADKRRVRRTIKDLQRIRTWQLLVLLVLASFVAATFLRLNNTGMVERRTAVINADAGGNQDDIIRRLSDLQQYVSAHMNTDLGKGVYLETSFNHDYQAWQTAAYGDANPSGNIYKKAQDVCAPKFTHYSTAYLQCTTSELAKYPAAADPGSGTGAPNSANYVHDYVSPFWSPDFAGWSVVVCVVIGLMIIARLVSLGVLRLLLHRHYKSV